MADNLFLKIIKCNITHRFSFNEKSLFFLFLQVLLFGHSDFDEWAIEINVPGTLNGLNVNPINAIITKNNTKVIEVRCLSLVVLLLSSVMDFQNVDLRMLEQ